MSRAILRRALAYPVVLLLAAAAVALAVEVVTRVLAHALGKCHPVCIVVYDAALGWTNAPGAVGRHRQPALGVDVVYRIDARGTRATGATSIPTGDVPRIVVLGDSNGFGWGVAEDHHFAALLSASGAARVLNLSVSGYGTDQALLRFVAEGLSFRPQIVVLQVTPNDFDDIQATMIAGRAKPRFTLADRTLVLSNVPASVDPADAPRLAGSPWLPVSAQAWLARNSYAYAWLDERGRSARAAPSAPPRHSSDSLALFRALVERLQATAATIGATVVLVHAAPELRERLANAIPPSVHVMDVAERFAVDGPALFADNLHWNDRGHRLVAAALADWLSVGRWRGGTTIDQDASALARQSGITRPGRDR